MREVKNIAVIQILFVVSAFAQIERSVDEAPGLQPGTKAPLFSAIDASSSIYTLEESLKAGPMVVIFYRGHWCPYCTTHLKQIQDSLDLIYAKGASVVAISLQNPEYLNKMELKAGTTFFLLYDEGDTIEDAYEVTFLPKPKQTTTYNVALNGSIDWFCFPNFDSPSIFAKILDYRLGGYYCICPTTEFKTKQFYWPDTNVLITRFLTEDGIVEVSDFMPVGTQLKSESDFRIIRRVKGINGNVKMLMDCFPAFNYARDEHELIISEVVNI